MKNIRTAVIITALFLFGIVPGYADSTHPQGIKLDGTVGTAGKIELPGPDYAIKPEYGRQAGPNLFHSFAQFNIHQGESATFSGPASVKNIISRVTGGSPSWIDGKLTSIIPGADLYFLNPSGVMFGANASLDLQGSFHVSTADYLRMGDNGRFYSTPMANEVLSVAAPSSFGFLNDTPGKISADGSFLQVSEGKTLSLIGGDIEQHNSILYAPGGRINMASCASAGEIKLGETDRIERGGNIAISRVNDNAYGDIEVGDIQGGHNGGSVFIRGGNIVMERAVIESFSSGGNSGDIKLKANTLTLSNNAQIVNAILESDQAENNAEKSKAGNVDIEAEKITLTDGAQIGNITRGSGDAGNINIRVADALSISGTNTSGAANDFTTGIFADSSGAGNAGNIDIEAGQIKLRDGSQIGSSTSGSGKGGTISIRADEITVSEKAIVLANASGTGKAGRIDIQTGQLQLKEGSQISTSSFGAGEGGTIAISADKVTASGMVNDTPSGIFANSTSTEFGAGNAGTIDIHARQINLTDAGTIRSMTYGPGEGGTINIIADEALTISDIVKDIPSGIFANADGQGNAGSIDIHAGQIKLTDGSQISSATSGSGQGGTIKITADDILSVSGKAIINARSSSTGKVGSIDIQARRIQLTDISEISNSTSGSGEGGTIKIIADELTASGRIGNTPSGIIASSYSTEVGAGAAGVIDIHARQIHLTDGAVIGSHTMGSGEGGTINIEADESFSASGYGGGIYASSYSTEAGAGTAGVIDIHARQIHLTEGGRIISHTMGTGEGGKITINADEVIVSGVVNNFQSGVFASSDSTEAGAGTAGVINIHARQIHFSDEGRIRNSTSGPGEGGKINIIADEALIASNSAIVANSSGTGNGGSINIQAAQIQLTDGSQIGSSTFGLGEGGKINIIADEVTASGFVNDVPSGIFAISTGTEAGAGKAGSIEIQAGQIQLRDGAQFSSTTLGTGEGGKIIIEADEVSSSGLSEDGHPSGIFARSQGTGNAGEIIINAAGSVRLTDAASVSTEALSAGGGKININAGNSIYLSNSQISSTVNQGQGSGGDVSTRSKFVILNHSKITANAQDGDGGAVFIQAENFLKSADSSVTATSERGNQGTVEIQAPDLDLSGALMFLPGSILDVTQFAPTPCYARSGRTFSSFVIKGPDAVPAPPDDLQSLPVSEADAEAVGSEGTSSVSEYLNLSDYFGKKKFSPENKRCEGCNRK